MKNVFVTLMLSMLALSASAQSVASLLDLKEIRSLPDIRVTAVEVHPGPRMAAVQPTAFLKFKYVSCAVQTLTANVEEQDGILYVAVDVVPNSFDCMGPTHERDYQLQISSDFRHQRVVVINPTRQLIYQ